MELKNVKYMNLRYINNDIIPKRNYKK